MIHGLEDLDVQLLCLRRVKRHLQRHKSICETLNAETNGTMPHVGVARFGNGVEVDIDDTVKVEGYNLADIMKLLEVVYTIFDKCGKSDGGKIADSSLVRGRVFDDLGA